MPAQYGLIGYPLTHSFSPGYFSRKFEQEKIDAVYSSFELPVIAAFPSLLKANPDLRGINVTIPHKSSIMGFLHTVDDAARDIGAVNCIDMRNGRLKGYNTDVIGFRTSLLPLLSSHHKQALILGSGGSSLAVQYVLRQLGIPFILVSRKKTLDVLQYAMLTDELVQQYTLIVNTTPLGMYPNTDSCPAIPYHALTQHHLLYDLVYNPLETKFLALGAAQGASVKNGLELLYLQAAASWEIWNR